MCKSCLLTEGGVDLVEEVRRKIRVGMRCGKSNDYFKRLMHNGCPSGRKHCCMCGINNGGKSSTKGKGRNKNGGHNFKCMTGPK